MSHCHFLYESSYKKFGQLTQGVYQVGSSSCWSPGLEQSHVFFSTTGGNFVYGFGSSPLSCSPAPVSKCRLSPRLECRQSCDRWSVPLSRACSLANDPQELWSGQLISVPKEASLCLSRDPPPLSHQPRNPLRCRRPLMMSSPRCTRCLDLSSWCWKRVYTCFTERWTRIRPPFSHFYLRWPLSLIHTGGFQISFTTGSRDETYRKEDTLRESR